MSKVESVTFVAIVSFRCLADLGTCYPGFPYSLTPRPRLAFPMREPIFQPLPDKPDHPGARAGDARALGGRRHVREAARAEQRRADLLLHRRAGHGEQVWLGVHTAWGRTLKDVFQRYKASAATTSATRTASTARGSGSRCGSSASSASTRSARSRSTGSRSSRTTAATSSSFVRHPDRAARSGSGSGWTGATTTSPSATRTSSTSGGCSRPCTAKDWLYKGHRSTEWCPRCGTSLSQHELTGEEYYEELEPIRRSSSASRCSTATGSRSWCGRRRRGRCRRTSRQPSTRTRSTDAATNGEWVAVDALSGRARSRSASAARSSSGSTYDGPFDHLPAQEGVDHRVIPWDDVSLDEGTGIVHIAPGCGAEDFELCACPRPAGACAGRRVGTILRRLRLARTASRRIEVADQIIGDLRETRPARRGRRRSSTAIPSAGAATRRSSSASSTTGSSRPTRSGSRCSTRTRRSSGRRRVHGQADGRLAPQHGRLEHLPPPLLRPAAARSTRASAGT